MIQTDTGKTPALAQCLPGEGLYRIVSIRIKEGREGGRLFVAVGRFELLVGLLALCLLFASGSVAQQRHSPTASKESLEAIVLHGFR